MTTQSIYNFVNKILIYLHPPLKIKKESWLKLWKERDNISFKKTATLGLLAFAFMYAIHFFLVDIPLKKQPIELWRNARSIGTAGFLIALILLRFTHLKYFRLPTIFAGYLATYMQGEFMVWRKDVHYQYSVIVPVLIAVILRISPLFSIAFLLIAYCIEFHAWQTRPDELPYIISAAIVGLGAVVIFSSRISSDVDLFISEQERSEANDKIINFQKELLERKMQEAFNLEVSASLGKMAAQIVHDIRSPLAVLKAVVSDLPEVGEDKRTLLRASIARIHDIAHILLQQYRKQTKNLSDALTFSSEIKEIRPILVASLADGIASEMRARYQAQDKIKIEFNSNYESFGLCAQANEIELKRVLSNLINNAVEALDGNGLVQVKLEEEGEKYIILSVIDTGKGIPPEQLSQLGSFGATFGKKEGLGLGLYHARTQIENLGGKLEIKSDLGKGTEVSIFLPKEPTPEWFVKTISLKANTHIFVLDDDPSIHRVWDHRLSLIDLNKHNITISHFYDPHELMNTCNSLNAIAASGPLKSTPTHIEQYPRAYLFLIDFELIGSSINGIQLIEQLKVADKAILITGQYEDDTIIDDCKRLKIKLLPKNMAGVIHINI